jgi:hypothetical protein
LFPRKKAPREIARARTFSVRPSASQRKRTNQPAGHQRTEKQSNVGPISVLSELPESATWWDFARVVIERQRVEEGIADLDAGITWSSDKIRNKLGIPK